MTAAPFDTYRTAADRADMVAYVMARHCHNMVPNSSSQKFFDPMEFARNQLRSLDHVGLATLWSEMQEQLRRSRSEQYDPYGFAKGAG